MPKSTMVRRWLLTINNEERSDEELKKYIEDLEHFKYCMFQREKGSETGTEHIQAFIIFSIGKRLETVKNYFPRAHLEQVKGSNSQARDYCSKSDTRVSGPFELGQFAEERERTDIKEFLALIENNSSNIDIKKLFPNLYVKNYDKIDKLRQEELFTEYESKIRNVEVTYIYGVPGIGKTSYVYKLFGFKDVYRITSYNKNLFDNYKGQKVLVFDEFNSQLKIEEMLNYLDIYPLWLPCRYNNKVACFDKIFLISNLPLSQQYLNIQNFSPEQYQALLRRIHKVMKL